MLISRTVTDSSCEMNSEGRETLLSVPISLFRDQLFRSQPTPLPPDASLTTRVVLERAAHDVFTVAYPDMPLLARGGGDDPRLVLETPPSPPRPLPQSALASTTQHSFDGPRHSVEEFEGGGGEGSRGRTDESRGVSGAASVVVLSQPPPPLLQRRQLICRDEDEADREDYRIVGAEEEEDDEDEDGEPSLGGTSSGKSVIAAEERVMLDGHVYFPCVSCFPRPLFTSQMRWLQHSLRKHKLKGHLQCPVCKALYDSWRSLCAHHQGQHQGFRYTCVLCEAKFATKFNLNRHLRVHYERNKCDQ